MTDLADLARTPELVTDCCGALEAPTTEFRDEARTIARRAELESPINRAPSATDSHGSRIARQPGRRARSSH